MRIRSAAEADYDAVARLFTELGEDPALMTRERWRSELVPHALLVEQGSAIIAYAVISPLRDTGFIRYIAVDPAHRRRGIARSLMAEIASRFRQAGCTSWRLNVRKSNTAAIRLYERAGMTHAHDVIDLELTPQMAQQLPRAEDRITPFTPEADAAIESALSLPRGLFAMARAPQRIFLMAERDTALTGAAMFAPELQLSFPFRAADSQTARALTKAMFTHSANDNATITISIENDTPLVTELCTAGATIASTSTHMTGTLDHPTHSVSSSTDPRT